MNTPLGEQLLKLRECAIKNGMKTLSEDEINFSPDSRLIGSNVNYPKSKELGAYVVQKITQVILLLLRKIERI